MKYTCENELRNFQAWGGGKAVLEALLDDAYRAIKRKFGMRVRQTAEIDSIVRYEFEGYM